jgi:hypothetical protein
MSMPDELREEAKEIAYMKKYHLEQCSECWRIFPEAEMLNGICEDCDRIQREEDNNE